MLRSGGIGNLGPLQSCQGLLGLEGLLPPPKSGFPISSRRMRRPGFIPICAAHLFVHKVRFDAMEGCKTSTIFLYIQCVSLENSLGKLEKWGEP